MQINSISRHGFWAVLQEYSKTCLKQPLKIDKIKVLIENGSLMKVKVLQNAPLGAFSNTFDQHLAITGIE